jgi:hypothetical protein
MDKKLARKVYFYIYLKTFCIYHHLEPVGHGVTQVAQHGLIQGDPQLLELGLQPCSSRHPS